MAVRIFIDNDNKNEYWDASKKREVFILNIMPGVGDAVEITFTREFTFGNKVFKPGTKINAIVLSIDYEDMEIVAPFEMADCSCENMIPVTMYLSPDCGFDIRIVNRYKSSKGVDNND